MQWAILILVVIMVGLKGQSLAAQCPSYHFSHLTVDEGLNDGFVTAICQDKYGYMWFGSKGGVSRYDGHSFRLFNNIPGDTTTPPGHLVECMELDREGRLWIGFESGLTEYNYVDATFTHHDAFRGMRINCLLAESDSALYVGTFDGLYRYHPDTGSADHISLADTNGLSFTSNRIYDLYHFGSSLFIAGSNGVYSLNLDSGNLSRIKLPLIGYNPVRSISIDGSGNLWIGTFGEIQLMRYHPEDGSFEVYDKFLSTKRYTTSNNVTDILTDSKGRVWVTTSVDGLLGYNAAENIFCKYVNNPQLPNSPGSDLHRSIFCDRNGVIWLGGNFGLDVFDPTNTLFHTIFPFSDSLHIRNRRIARGFAEDADGNYWFTTFDGVVRFDPRSGKYRVWRNTPGKPTVVYYNSIRGAVADRSGRVWIATGAGVNVYEPYEDVMRFVPADSLPVVFYFTAVQDRRGRIWFGARDGAGFYWYDPQTDSYHDISEDPALRRLAGFGGRCFLEDRDGRYWFGFNGSGLGMHDPGAQETVHWNADSAGQNTIIGNMVIDLAEDSTGVIWVSTYNGISGIDPKTRAIRSLTSKDGLLSNSCSALAVDALNRLWVATTRGICMIDAKRENIVSFQTRDGLPASEFPEHQAHTTKIGTFVFPSNNGFVLFDPLNYQPGKGYPACYVSGIKILNQPYHVKGEISEFDHLRLGSSENSVAFELAALNFTEPHRIWYASKLEGFDKEWRYSQDREISYTNLPGGKYTLLIKAALNNSEWETIPAKILQIRVGTIFYKAWWFYLFLTFMTVGGISWFHAFRLRKHRQLLELSNLSQRLEKEKAIVMYESLKEQLNPHFLFNSLTSLRSLINTMPAKAGEFLDGLSKTYRYILTNRDNVTVPISQEIQSAKTYVNLQRVRFSRGFQVNFNLDDSVHDRSIVPVTLQNLIENAIKHNLIDEASPLVIEIYADNTFIFVRNNLQRKEFVATSNRQGLKNLQSLYRYLTDVPLEILDDGDAFTVKIPLL